MARSARHAEQISARLVALLCAGRDGVSFPLGRRAQLALVLRVLARPTCDPGRPKSGSQRTRPWRETDSTLGPSPKDPLLAGEPKKASSTSSTPRMRLGPQGDRGTKPAPFYESAEPNIPAASYAGWPARQAPAKLSPFSIAGSTACRQGPMVRIHFPPARSQQRTLWLPGASHAGGTQSSNPLCSCRESANYRLRDSLDRLVRPASNASTLSAGSPTSLPRRSCALVG